MAADHEDGEVLYQQLERLFVGLKTWLETDPTAEQRELMANHARRRLEQLVEMDVDAPAVEAFQRKIAGGLDHWLTFVREPAVKPTNNAAEHALREPVVLRKIIGTLRNENGIFVHETLLSLLATWHQQDRNPYEELKRVLRDW